jgi:shikimate kinase
VKRVLLTGMSGTGKSAVVRELVARGYRAIILLSAPVETLVDRLASRTSNSFGKAPGELHRVLDDVQAVEPRLRRAADHEIQTTVPVPEVVTTILRLV